VSARWYGDVFGFKVFERLTEDAYDEAVLIHPPTGTILCLQQHRTNGGEIFDPARTGADHVAFRVASREDLDRWERLLTDKAVVHSPVAERHYGSVLCVRDPDGIQLELFHRENHP
jgi:glyoxylase I family protein